MEGFITAFRSWLPYNRYLFRGGPADGQRLPVTLHEFRNGMGPPDHWRVEEPLTLPLLGACTGPIETQDIVQRVHTYRFVPVSFWNEGYFELVENT